MRDLGDGPRGVAVFVCQLLSARRFFKKGKKNGAPRLGNFIGAHFGRLMMCLFYVCSRRNFGKKKTFSGKGTENYAL